MNRFDTDYDLDDELPLGQKTERVILEEIINEEEGSSTSVKPSVKKHQRSGSSKPNSKRQRQVSVKQAEMDDVFVEVLDEMGRVLLQKSQTLAMRAKKQKALEEMSEHLLAKYGLEYSTDQITKKVNNMKSKIKEKTDLKQTGNKKISMNVPQKKFYDLLGGVENPSINNLSYGVTVGGGAQNNRKPLVEQNEQDASSDELDASPSVSSVRLTPKTPSRSVTAATRNVTQQMVYAEQIKLIKDQQNYTALLQANQQERHDKEMELLNLKKEIAELKIKMLKENTFV